MCSLKFLQKELKKKEIIPDDPQCSAELIPDDPQCSAEFEHLAEINQPFISNLPYPQTPEVSPLPNRKEKKKKTCPVWVLKSINL